MLKVGLHDRHVLGQFQAVDRVSVIVVVIVNEPVVAARRKLPRRVRAAQPVNQLLLHTVRDDEYQEGHAVWVVLAEA
eukprot:scaffold876_cov68-Phaeocystis_antarctica.AAC.8